MTRRSSSIFFLIGGDSGKSISSEDSVVKIMSPSNSDSPGLVSNCIHSFRSTHNLIHNWWSRVKVVVQSSERNCVTIRFESFCRLYRLRFLGGLSDKWLYDTYMDIHTTNFHDFGPEEESSRDAIPQIYGGPRPQLAVSPLGK